MTVDTAITHVNLIPNGDFRQGRSGELPAGWECVCPNPVLAPAFRLGRWQGKPVLAIAGNGEEDCIGYVHRSISLEGGCGYEFSARFHMSAGVNPQQHLLFALYAGDYNNGIFHFCRLPEHRAEGSAHFFLPGEGILEGDVRIYFRQSPRGKVRVEEVQLQPCSPPPPRWVRLACTNGVGTRADWERVLDAVGQEKCDLVLLPETINGEIAEPLDGPCAALMAAKAAEYRMNVAGGLLHDIERMVGCTTWRCSMTGKASLAGNMRKTIPSPLNSCSAASSRVTPCRSFRAISAQSASSSATIAGSPTSASCWHCVGQKELVLFPNAGIMPACCRRGRRTTASASWPAVGSPVMGCGTLPDARPQLPMRTPPAARISPLRCAMCANCRSAPLPCCWRRWICSHPHPRITGVDRYSSAGRSTQSARTAPAAVPGDSAGAGAVVGEVMWMRRLG